MSLADIDIDCTNRILDYLPLVDLYLYSSNSKSFQIFKEQVSRRTLGGSLEGLQAAIYHKDSFFARYVLKVIKTLPEAQNYKYWHHIIHSLSQYRSAWIWILELILEATQDPLLLIEINYTPYDISYILANSPRLLDIYIPFFGQNIQHREVEYIEHRGYRVRSFSRLVPFMPDGIFIKFLEEEDFTQLEILGRNLPEKLIPIQGMVSYIIRRKMLRGRVLDVKFLTTFVRANREILLSLLGDPLTVGKNFVSLGQEIGELPRLLIPLDEQSYIRYAEEYILPKDQRRDLIRVLSLKTQEDS